MAGREDYKMIYLKYISAILILASYGCSGQDDGHVFTLYSNAASNLSARLHISTFDAYIGKDHPDARKFQAAAGIANQASCQKVADLLKEDWDRSVKFEPNVKFWCEKGVFRK